MGSIITIGCIFGILIIIGIVAAAIENEKIALMISYEKQKYLGEKQSRSEKHKPVNTTPVKKVVRRKKNQLSTGEKVTRETVKVGVKLAGGLIKGLFDVGKKR